VVAADQAGKAWAHASLAAGRETTVVAGWLWFRLLRNTGATLGLLTGHSELIGSLSLLIVALLAVLAIRASAGGMAGVIAMGAVIGGALSNLIDRLRLGGVTDFIEVRFWPTDFNLADLAIRLGVLAFLLSLLVELRRPRRRRSIV
jgi:signal peptidase II